MEAIAFAAMSDMKDTGKVSLRTRRTRKQTPKVEMMHFQECDTSTKPKATVGSVLKKASQKAFRGGIAGFAAGVVQVGAFMWMRTIMNYQYRNGGSLVAAAQELYKQGGIGRFYQGVQYAVIQNPLSRFGDTAANTGVLAVLEAFYPQMPVAAMTGFASAGGSTWRIFITPVDTLKTTLQVEGKAGMELLGKKIKAGGMGVLYGGCFANFAANWVGSYPWFATFNYLQANVPKADGKKKLIRNAAIGIVASFVSDCCSNSLRVIKTIKQTSGDASLSYVGAIKGVIKTDGITGLFGRGLTTRLITNCMQSMVFSVAWKAIEEELNKPKAKKVVAEPQLSQGVLGLPPLPNRRSVVHA
jgi:hypothetical protein